MRIRLGVTIGCFALIGVMFPVWRYLDQKEKEAQAKYEIYEQIHQQEEKKNQEISRVNRIKEQQNKVEKELEPYENLLDSIQTVRETYIPQKDIPLTDFQDAFLKAPNHPKSILYPYVGETTKDCTGYFLLIGKEGSVGYHIIGFTYRTEKYEAQWKKESGITVKKR